jgi:hypothetical protein
MVRLGACYYRGQMVSVTKNTDNWSGTSCDELLRCVGHSLEIENLLLIQDEFSVEHGET